MPAGETILVIDDEIVILSVIQAMLTDRGYRVVTAQSGREAVLLLHQWPDLKVQLALIDVVMPDMGGVETVQKLRKQRPNLPVLMMSGYYDDRGAWSDDARNLPLISKPFTATSLVARIVETLGQEKSDSVSGKAQGA